MPSRDICMYAQPEQRTRARFARSTHIHFSLILHFHFGAYATHKAFGVAFGPCSYSDRSHIKWLLGRKSSEKVKKMKMPKKKRGKNWCVNRNVHQISSFERICDSKFCYTHTTRAKSKCVFLVNIVYFRLSSER